MKFIDSAIKITVFTAIFIGCGSNKVAKNEAIVEKTKSFIANDNFVNVAQYYYTKTASKLENKNNESDVISAQYPGEKKDRDYKKHDKDTFYVDYVAPFNKYIEKLSISYNDEKINLDITDNMVVIKYSDGVKNLLKNLTFEEFAKTNQSLQVEGE